MRIKELGSKFILLLLGIIISLFAGELCLRGSKNYSLSYYETNTLTRGDLSRQYSRYKPSYVLGYEHIPNSPGINSYGMVGREYKLKKEKGVYRILLIGDSIAENNWSAEFLEEKLNTNLLMINRFRKFEIWNAGVGGYNIKQYANYLKYKGIRYNPDLVIVFFSLNDFIFDTWVYYKTKEDFIEYYFPAHELSKFYLPNQFLFKHSYLYRSVLIKLEHCLLSKKQMQNNYTYQEGRFYLNTIKSICDNRGIPLLFIIFPYLKTMDEYEDYARNNYAIVSDLLKDLKINYIDLHIYFPEKGRHYFKSQEYDCIHPNKEGHKLVASVIYNYLISNMLTK